MKARISSGRAGVFFLSSATCLLAACSSNPHETDLPWLVNHGHFAVDGHKVDIPSCLVKPGSVVVLRESSRKNEAVRSCLDTAAGRGIPPWLELDAEQFKGTVKQLPTREDITMPIQEQLIVELYSK